MNKYFGFNKQQRNGLLVLISISFLLLVIRIIYPYFLTSDTIIVKNLPLYEQQLDSLSQINSKEKYSGANYSKDKKVPVFFMFDPNKVSHEQLLSLGFKAKTADVFIKFRNKGFVFRQKEDLKKVYGVSEKFYFEIEPYIQINQSINEKSAPIKESPATTISSRKIEALFDLNKADSLELISLSGIGSTYANRIIKYRQLLGGYVKIKQLMEVYGITEDLFNKVKPHLFIEAEQQKKINLNTASFKDINKHPYISYELCKLIVQQRSKNNLSLEGFRILINDTALYSKLIPYLAFE